MKFRAVLQPIISFNTLLGTAPVQISSRIRTATGRLFTYNITMIVLVLIATSTSFTLRLYIGYFEHFAATVALVEMTEQITLALLVLCELVKPLVFYTDHVKRAIHAIETFDAIFGGDHARVTFVRVGLLASACSFVTMAVFLYHFIRELYVNTHWFCVFTYLFMIYNLYYVTVLFFYTLYAIVARLKRANAMLERVFERDRSTLELVLKCHGSLIDAVRLLDRAYGSSSLFLYFLPFPYVVYTVSLWMFYKPHGEIDRFVWNRVVLTQLYVVNAVSIFVSVTMFEVNFLGNYESYRKFVMK